MDVRYQGQGYELNVPYTGKLIQDFRSEHQRRYGYSYPDREVELVTLRLRATIKSPQARLAQAVAKTRWGRAPRPSGPGEARQRVAEAGPCVFRREKGRRSDPRPRNAAGRQEIFRPCRRHRVQRHHRGSSRDEFRDG